MCNGINNSYEDNDNTFYMVWIITNFDHKLCILIKFYSCQFKIALFFSHIYLSVHTIYLLIPKNYYIKKIVSVLYA